MPPNEANSPDDRFTALLAEMDESLAAGSTAHDVLATELADASLTQRLRRAQVCLQLIANVRLSAPESLENSAILPESWPVARESRDYPAELGRFRIVREIGRGGSGVVFLAIDPDLDREVALKVPRPEALLTADLRKRFLREAKAAASLSHANIVPVFEADSVGPICYIASAYCKGRSLAEWLRARGSPVDAPTAAQLIATLAEAVQHAHDRGVVHRDLKPGNVLLEGESGEPSSVNPKANGGTSVVRTETVPLRPRIADFGLAKTLHAAPDQTRQGAIIGTPSYMAPEQAAGRTTELGPAADIYGLGAILYEVLTGRPPFRRDTDLATLQAVQTEEPVAPRKIMPVLPRDLEAICLKCLEKLPAHRYPTATALSRDLLRFISGEPVQARPIGSTQRLVRWCRRNRAFAAIAATAATLLVVALAASTVGWLSTASALDQARAARDDARLRLRTTQQAVDDLLLAVENSPEMKLKGFEPLRHQILSRADNYYRQFSQDAPDDPQLKEQYDEIQFRLARVKSALGDYEGAESVASLLLGELPDPSASTKEQLKRRITLSIFLAGQYFRTGNKDQRERLFQSSLNLARATFAVDQSSIDDQIELATTLSQLVGILTEWGDMTASANLANEAVGIWDSLDMNTIEDSETLLAIGKVYAAAGKTLAASENTAQAIPRVQKAIEVFELLYQDRETVAPEARLLLADSLRIMGFLHDKDFDSATISFQRAQEVAISLVLEHPMIPAYHSRLIQVRTSYGLSHTINGKADDALTFFQQNVEDIPRLIARFPDLEQAFEGLLVNNYSLIGHACAQTKDHERSLETTRLARLLYEKEIQRTGGSPNAVLNLAMCDGNLAQLLIELDQLDQAASILENVIDSLLEHIQRDPQNGSARRFLWGDYEKLAIVQQKKGQPKSALENFQAGMTIFYSDVVHLYGKEAAYLARDGQFECAVSRFEDFVACEPDFGVYSTTNHHCNVERAIRASQLIAAMAATQASDVDQQRRQAIFDQVASYGVAAIAALVSDPKQSHDVLEGLLAKDELKALWETPQFELWSSNQRR